MKINVKVGGKSIQCDVACGACKNRPCLNPHQWVTQSVNNNHTQKSKNYSCSTRDYRGCPDEYSKSIEFPGAQECDATDLP